MNKIQDRGTDFKKSVVQCFIVSVMSFHVYFDMQVHKKSENKISKQKKLKA